jgi:hypothetical protein
MTLLRCLCAAFVGLSSGLMAQAQSGPALRTQYESRQAALAKSPFRRPLLLESSASADAPHGEVFAVLDQPFGEVEAALRRPERWCEVLTLQTNVKRCEPSAETLRVAIVRKSDQPVDQAFQVDFRYAVPAASGDYLSVKLQAANGPVGTRDYRLALEAVPVGARQTFVHMSYSYAASMSARMATSAYLASAGRSKIGFTVSGHDDGGQPVYVGGMQGVAERNTMRYFLAIEALLHTLSAAEAQRLDTRLRDFHAAIEKYPRQLHELSLDDYLAMKRKESGRS